MVDLTPQKWHNVLHGVKRKKAATVAKTPEGRVKLLVREILDNTPTCWYFMPVQNGMGQSGIPDFICCVRGKLLGIETKSKYSSRKLTALQAKQIRLINEAQGVALMVNEDNLEDLKELLQTL